MPNEFEEELLNLEDMPSSKPRGIVNKRNLSANSNAEDLKEEITAILHNVTNPETFTIALCRFNPDNNSWPQIAKFTNVTPDNVPDSDSIGKKYGSGKYQTFLRWKDPDKKSKYATETRTFELGVEYDQYLKKETNTPSGLDSFKEAAAILTPLMNKGNSDMGPIFQSMMQQSQQSMQMMMTQMQNSQQLMMQQMQQSSQQNMQMMTQMTQMLVTVMAKPQETHLDKLLEIIVEKQEKSSNPMEELRNNMTFLKELKGDSSEDKEESTVMQVTQMVLQFLPLLMDKAVDAMKVKAMISTNPDAQKVLANPQQMQRIGQELAKRGLSNEELKIINEKTGIPNVNEKPVAIEQKVMDF